MRCVVQRVKSASVAVDGEIVSKIGKGLCVLVGLAEEDNEEAMQFMTRKLLGLKFFEGEDGKPWKGNVKDINGEILLVSQFTLYYRYKGNNLDFSKSMPPTPAKEAYSRFVEMMRCEFREADKVKDGRFGTMMEVDIVNDGPVTVQIEWPEPSTQKKS